VLPEVVVDDVVVDDDDDDDDDCVVVVEDDRLVDADNCFHCSFITSFNWSLSILYHGVDIEVAEVDVEFRGSGILFCSFKRLSGTFVGIEVV